MGGRDEDGSGLEELGEGDGWDIGFGGKSVADEGGKRIVSGWNWGEWKWRKEGIRG